MSNQNKNLDWAGKVAAGTLLTCVCAIALATTWRVVTWIIG